MDKIDILLVEDESIEAMDIKRTLESFGYNVPYIASNGKDAIQKAEEINPDLILMDIILKGNIDGIEAVSMIKDLDIPVIYLTAHSEESTIERAKLTAPFGYILKPYDVNELRYAIELALYKNKTDQVLRKSEKKFRRIIENLQDAYFQADKDGKFIMVSPSAAKIYRYNAPEEMIGMPAQTLYKNRSDRLFMLKELEKKGRVENLQLEGIRKDGTTFWVSLNAQYYYDEQGQIIGTEGFVRDITDLKNEETKYRTLFENTGTATIIVEKNSTIALVNKKFEQLSGYSKDEIEGKRKWTEFVAPPDLKKMIKYHQIRRDDPENVPSIYDFTFLNRDGQEKNIQLFVDLIPGTEKSVASLLDITLRIQKEKSLLESEEKYKALFEMDPNYIILLDLDGVILDVNHAAAKVTDSSKKNLIGKHFTELDIFLPEELEKYQDVFSILQKEGHIEPFESRIVDKEGNIRWIQINNISMVKDYQHPFIMLICNDITQNKKEKERILESTNQLSSILNAIPDLLFEVDEEGRIYEYNAPHPDELYTDPENFLGKKVSEVLPPESADIILKALKEAAITGNHYGKVFELSYPDGNKYFELSISKKPFPQEKPHFIVLARNISDRKTYEKESEKELSILVENIVDEVWFCDVKGNIILANAAARVFEQKAEQKSKTTLNGLINSVKVYDADGQPRPKEGSPLIRSLKGEILTDLKEIVVFPSTGEKRYRQVSSAPIKTDGELMGAVAVVRDITRQKMAEEKLRIHNERLNISLELHQMVDAPMKIVLDFVLEACLKTTQSKYAFIGLMSEDESVMHIHAWSQHAKKECSLTESPIHFPISDAGLWGECIRQRKPVMVNDYENSELFKKGYPQGHVPIKRFMGMPVFDGEKIVAIAAVANKEEKYEKEDILVFNSLLNDAWKLIKRKNDEESIRKSLEEKETLLRELQHRVKNNLQIIASLLRLQELSVNNEARHVLEESEGRVTSMAMIHEKVYQSPDFNYINFKQYLEKLVSNIITTYTHNSNITTQIDIKDINLNIDTAIPLGLIVNELVTNSVKHAFPQGKGEIMISMQKKKETYTLEVVDNGIGLPPNLDYRKTQTLGLQLVTSLIGQIDGEISLDRSEGTKFKIIFREIKYKDRI